MFNIKLNVDLSNKSTTRHSSSSSKAGTTLFNLANVSQADVLKFLNGKSGIYKWTNSLNGKSYVGSSISLHRRIQEYFNPERSLRELKRGESMLYKSLMKYGYLNFTLEILEVLDIAELSSVEARLLLLTREQHYIDLIDPEYNILKVAGSNLGAKMSPETREKISKAKLGMPSHRKGLTGLKAFTVESLHKMSENSGMKKSIYVYSLDHVLLFKPFPSIKLCALNLELSRFQISRALDKDKIVDKYLFLSDIREEWDNSILA
jgi:group I intron endonuclease